MPDMQSPVPSAPVAEPAVPDAPLAFEDPDYAFGCECADPALQIPYWAQEARAAGP